MAIPELTPAQDSLFLTLGSRALDSRLPRPFLGDVRSDEVLTAVGYDVDKFPTLSAKGLDPRTKVFDVAVRTKYLDQMVRAFLQRNPTAVVVDLGAGLDPRQSRVDPPAGVDWYDVDFPEVIALRGEVLPGGVNSHPVGADLTHPDWCTAIPADRPAMVIADGLMPFLTRADVLTLLNRVTAHFPSGELALNCYSTPVAWTLKNTRLMAPIARGMVNPGISNPHRLEEWVPGIRLVEEVFLTRVPEVAELPAASRWTSHLTAPSKAVSRVMRTMVLHYRF